MTASICLGLGMELALPLQSCTSCLLLYLAIVPPWCFYSIPRSRLILGLNVENATLNRFLSLHYLLPFIIAGNSVVHLAALHQYGSNHPLVGANPVDKSAF